MAETTKHSPRVLAVGDQISQLCEVLALRRAVSQAATSKFVKLEKIQYDGRVYDMFQFSGASRTGRWAGRGLQLQNLRRSPKNALEISGAIREGTFDEKFGGNKALDQLGSVVRSALTATKGHQLVVCDLSAIESRVLGWLSGDLNLMGVFELGLDPYIHFATRMFSKPYAEITKEERTLAKPAVLGCGYGLGPDGLVSYADSMGIAMTKEQTKTAVTAFRSTYSEIPSLWRTVQASFFESLWGDSAELPFLRFAKEGDMVAIRLPSGRKLYYNKPQQDPDLGLCYWGFDQYTRRWALIKTYGAKLVENLVQAIARDILVYGMHLAEKAGLHIVGHVHDEIILEEPKAVAEAAFLKLIKCMSTTPPWAGRLLLAAAGYIADEYRKE